MRALLEALGESQGAGQMTREVMSLTREASILALKTLQESSPDMFVHPEAYGFVPLTNVGGDSLVA